MPLPSFVPPSILRRYASRKLIINLPFLLLFQLLLQFWHPGGVKHASKTPTNDRGKESTVTGKIDLPRAKIDVEVRSGGLSPVPTCTLLTSCSRHCSTQLRHISLAWKRRSFKPFFGAAEKKILRDVSASFPAGPPRPTLPALSASQLKLM
jgi:hypothetical protein